MAIFNGHVITNEGRNLLGRALAGEGKIILTRAAMGDGKPSQDIRNLTALISEKMTANIADIFNDRGTVNLKVQITNSTLEEAFKTEEFGIFAKIEGDKEEILYSYCNAVEADTIPSNSLGDIFVEEHTVYIAFSSDAEADIYIKEGAVFLTLETANKNYIQTGLKVEGKLNNGRTELHENCQYQGDDGKWYFNIGGDREWIAGTGTPDELLVEISYFKLYENLNKLSLEKFDKGTVPTALNSAEKVVAALQATTGLKFDPNKLYLNDPGINEEGFCYLDRLRDGIFKCLVRNEDGVNDSSKFEDISNKANSDRLDNLQKIYPEFKIENDGIYYVCNRIGNIVNVTITQNTPRETIDSSKLAGTLPSYMVPKSDVIIICDAMSYFSFVEVNISSDSNVSYKRRNAGTYSFGNASYFAKDIY